MKVIKEIYHDEIGLARSIDKVKYEIRKAARAVLVNENNQVAVLYVSKDNYYKLPGGGIKKDESTYEALSREIDEEVGTSMEIIDEVGMTIEYRELFEQLQISYSFICNTKGKLTKPKFTQKELDDGFALKWMSIDDAIKAIQSYKGDKYIAKFICYRDTQIINEAKKIISQRIQ